MNKSVSVLQSNKQNVKKRRRKKGWYTESWFSLVFGYAKIYLKAWPLAI